MVDEQQISEEQMQQAAEQVAQQLQQQQATKPLVDTVILNQLVQADLPLRGNIREDFIRRVRNQIRQKRTVQGISNRVAARVITPVTNAFQDQLEETLSSQIRQQLEEVVQDES